jgi:ubiquinone/menaquinone biosynthesis C-methylase UbiE
MNIRFPEEVFDAAVSIGSIKHWPDAVRGLAEIRRVLKPGALLIVSETDQGASEAEIRRFMNRFKVWFVPDHLLFWGLRNVIFGQSFTQVSLTDAVKTAGFRRMEGLRVSEVPYVTVRAVK